jgi:hypothetical protein
MRRSVSRRDFDEQKAEWKAETAMFSSASKAAKHSAYRKIVGMGMAVVPFIMADLKQEPDHWFIALREITGANPVKPGHRGAVGLMAGDWVRWWENRVLSI